jgi:type 1 glutamine amidotransferase
VWIILYNLIEKHTHEPYQTSVTVKLRGLPKGVWRCVKTTIAPGACDPRLVWDAMGSPEKLTAEQKAILLEASELPGPQSVTFNDDELHVDMAGFSVTLLELRKLGPAPEGDPREIDSGAAKVEVTKAWQWPAKEQWESADLIVMQCYRSGGSTRTWNQQQIAQLEAYLSRGGSFVAVHPATYTLRDLSQPGGHRVAALTGLAFDRSILVRHGAMELKIAAEDHPICAGLPKTIELIDEPYWPPVGDMSKVTVLATSNERISKGSDNVRPQPMFWTARHGKGRIFACVPGHFVWTFDDPYFRILLLRGMAWAAGESPYRFDALVTRGVPLR